MSYLVDIQKYVSYEDKTKTQNVGFNPVYTTIGLTEASVTYFRTLPCAVKINGPWRNFIIWIFMGDIKIIFGVKVTYIDVHRPPTSWVGRRKWYRDRAEWWKYRGSEYEVIWVVQSISRYLNFENRDFLYENDFDTNFVKAAHSWGNFLIFHK